MDRFTQQVKLKRRNDVYSNIDVNNRPILKPFMEYTEVPIMHRKRSLTIDAIGVSERLDFMNWISCAAGECADW